MTSLDADNPRGDSIGAERSGTLALEAEVDDGTGTASLVWLGRRRIGGIEPGARVTAEGRYAETGR